MSLPNEKGLERLRTISKMIYAIIEMDIDVASQLLKAGLNPNTRDLEARYQWLVISHEAKGNHFLHEAVYASVKYPQKFDCAMIELLLDHGANPNAVSNEGYSPLHNAAITNNAQACRLLVRRGASINLQSTKGYTPLHTASVYGSSNATAMLLSMGADTRILNCHNESSREYAARMGDKAAISMIDASNNAIAAADALQDICRGKPKL